MLHLTQSRGAVVVLSFFTFLFVIPGLAAPLQAAAPVEQAAKLDGAKKEGKVVVYTNNSGIAPLIKRFEEKYPFVKVEYLRTGAPKLLNKVLTESRAGASNADIIETEGLTSYLMMKKGLYAKYVSPESKVYPAGARDPEGYWTGAHSNYKVVAYNTRMVAANEVPQTWDDIVQPKWKGKILLASNNYEWFGNVVKILGEEKGMAIMRKVAAQDLMLREGNTLILQLLSAGEGALALAANVDSVEETKAKGAKIDWVGVPPVVSRLHPIALAHNAPHPNAAKLYIDFVLSKEGQEIVTKELIGISDRPDVKKIFTKEGLKLYYADLSLADQYEEVTKKFDTVFKIR